MKNILSLTICLFSTIIFAEPKSLWCTDNDTLWVTKHLQAAPSKQAEMLAKQRELASEYPDVANNYKLYALEWERAKTMCVGSKWASAKEFIFDTDGLKNPAISDVEYTSHRLCGAKIDVVLKVKLSSTPSIISFTWTQPESSYNFMFNVDRKTLRAGDKTKRDYTCELRDIDTSDNLL